MIDIGYWESRAHAIRKLYKRYPFVSIVLKLMTFSFCFDITSRFYVILHSANKYEESRIPPIILLPVLAAIMAVATIAAHIVHNR